MRWRGLGHAMKARTSRRLVIDASVLRAAGETEHPTSVACRNALRAVLDICHHAVMTPDIRREWDSHMSRFSRKWWRSMAAHGKPTDAVTAPPLSLEMIDAPDWASKAILKDAHLLTAAEVADRIILIHDDALQRALASFDAGARLAGTLQWIDPVKDGSAPLQSL
jgi:hypothetical protein